MKNLNEREAGKGYPSPSLNEKNYRNSVKRKKRTSHSSGQKTKVSNGGEMKKMDALHAVLIGRKLHEEENSNCCGRGNCALQAALVGLRPAHGPRKGTEKQKLRSNRTALSTKKEEGASLIRKFGGGKQHTNGDRERRTGNERDVKPKPIKKREGACIPTSLIQQGSPIVTPIGGGPSELGREEGKRKKSLSRLVGWRRSLPEEDQRKK